MKRKCKIRRVRKDKDGSFNQEDINHNQKCRDLYELQDNPWMVDIFTKKKSSPYEKNYNQYTDTQLDKKYII